jgi:uncharacterized protein involved in outer membrane biogenesis
VKLLSSKRRVVIAAGIVLLCLFLIRPGVSRLKTRITIALSRAIARPVEIGSVHLRFLPQPGFDLDNLVVYEDPAFGSEPMLRAQEVTAVVRISSLLRGRLDIARLELTEPSVNLVRREDGRWNWQSLLERAANTPLAPTAKSKSEARLGFPYIEGSSGRINFKAGQEKKPYSLLNADFSLWQESENTWGARLKAEPLRTDMNVTDTGLLRVDGTWQRATSLRETPLQFSMEWNDAQLGQVSKLLSGNDKGWRGEIRLDAKLSGTPGAMQVALDTSVRDFHRYDIASVEGIRLAAHCDGRYSTTDAVMHEIACRAPVGDGEISLHGDAGLPAVHKLDLALKLDNVPVSSVAALARRAKKNLPADLAAAGSLRGGFTMKQDGRSPAEFQGKGEITNLVLKSVNTKVGFTVASVPLSLSSGALRENLPRATSGVLSDANDLHLEFGPFPLALGRPQPAQARGWISRAGYAMTIRGEGETAHTLRLASILGVPAIQANIEGTAQMDLQLAGTWSGNGASESAFSLPAVTGTAQLRNIRARVRGVNGPIEISSAELQLTREQTRLERMIARAADAAWTGSMSLPRGCGLSAACVVRFNLNTEDVGLTEISEWLSPQPGRRPWYQLLGSSSAAPTFLQNLTASGKVNARRLRIHGILAEKLSSGVDVDHGKLKLTNLQADLLGGGKHRGDWNADFSASPPVYAGTGTFTGISLQQIARAFHDSSIAGTAAGTYQISASGSNGAAFWQTAEGAMQFDVKDGLLSGISLNDDDSGLRISRWAGEIGLHAGKFEIGKNRLVSPAGVYEVSGTASLAAALNLDLTQTNDVKPGHVGALVYSITGTVAEPKVAIRETPQTQAKLKRQ